MLILPPIFLNGNQEPVSKSDAPDFLNDFFANIAERTTGALRLDKVRWFRLNLHCSVTR